MRYSTRYMSLEVAPALSEPPLQWQSLATGTATEGQNKFSFLPMDGNWTSLWEETAAELKRTLAQIQDREAQSYREGNCVSSSRLPLRPPSVLVYLMSMCGRDCGLFLRGLHSMTTRSGSDSGSRGISWGTYQDEMCRRDLAEWHCNAHANNFVIIPDISASKKVSRDLNAAGAAAAVSASAVEYKPLLSFLDLDMAFEDLKGAQSHDPIIDSHDKLLEWEFVNLLESLSGADSSTGTQLTVRSVIEASSTPVIRAVSASLRDHLVLACREAYFHAEPCTTSHPQYDSLLHSAAYSIIKLALILSANILA